MEPRLHRVCHIIFVLPFHFRKAVKCTFKAQHSTRPGLLFRHSVSCNNARKEKQAKKPVMKFVHSRSQLDVGYYFSLLNSICLVFSLVCNLTALYTAAVKTVFLLIWICILRQTDTCGVITSSRERE